MSANTSTTPTPTPTTAPHPPRLPQRAQPAELDPFACALDGVGLIEASAGTGKTWAICALYLRLLLECGLPVQQILVVTFTRAATAELKGRIRARMVETLGHLDGSTPSADPFVLGLAQRLAQRGPGGERPLSPAQQLDAALQAFDEAAIFTIHGYCQRALADTPFAAGLPFAIELEEDDLELRLEASRDFWRRHIAADAACADLAEILIARGDSPERWAELLRLDLARPMALRRWPDRAGAPERPDAQALASVFAQARELWRGDGAGVVQALLDALDQLNGQTYKADGVRAAAQGWTTLLSGVDPLAEVHAKAHRLELFSATTLALKTKKACVTPRDAFFDCAAILLGLREHRLAWLQWQRLELIRRFLDEGAQRLRAIKRERRRIAFDDILHNVHQALAGGRYPWLAAALHGRFPAALIDEFQDTDPLQFDIFRRIYAPADAAWRGRLFLVGDPKQAIYSFRNADLHTYLGARRHADAQYTLRHNQRSSAGLIHACNHLFAANPGAFVLDGLDFDPVSAGARARSHFADAGATSAAGAAALRVWWAPHSAEGALLTRTALVARAADASAAEIARLLGDAAAGRVTIGERPLEPGDIAVLVKTHRQGARMREALALRGIGCVELSQSSVFHSTDAEELERVLVAIAEPGRETLLFAACATALMGYDSTALASLAGDEDALPELVAQFAQLRDTWVARGIGIALRLWMTRYAVSARVLMRDDGERRLTNLLHLAEIVHEASASHSSPDALLRWFASRRAEDGHGEAAQLRLESDRNLVHIVTIHRAKGLEYGIVLCPFLFDGMPPRSDSGEARVYHESDLGDAPGGAEADTEGGGQAAPAGRDASGGERRLVMDFRPGIKDDEAVKARIRVEKDAESVRLLYVAMTRAVYRCYLVAGCYLRPGGGGVSHAESTRSLLNWLVAGKGSSYAAWLKAKHEPAEIDAAWRRLEQDATPHLAIEDLPRGDRTADAAEDAAALAAPETLQARRPPAFLPQGWRIGSFSALKHGAAREEAARDHDGRAPVAGDHDGRALVAGEALPGANGGFGRVAMQPPPDADDILLFPRGALAGECLHAVFERLDFTNPATRGAAISAALAAHPQATGALAAADALALQRRMLEHVIEDVLKTPLELGECGTMRLDSVPGARKCAELGFHLPAPQLDAMALNAWLARHGYEVPRLAFARLAGYLKGYIDLVFEHRGRYYVLDWKSNHLGDAPQDYALPCLEAAMRMHGYHLQHLLYGLAVHRHLANTLPGYAYETHYGGALYLFVRGVRPGWQYDGQHTGVYFHRPAVAVMESLDCLVRGGVAP